MRKVIIIFIVVILILTGIAFLINNMRKRSVKEEVVKPLPVEVIPVQRGDTKKTCEVIGTIMADKTAQVLPETMGRITGIMIKEGSYVRKDRKIMTIRNETVGFDYEEGYIKAPISGNVAKVLVDVGSMISPQTPVAMIVDYARVKVSFNISEVDMGCISKRSKLSVKTDALPDKNFTARVSEISPVVDPMTRTVSVKAVINNYKKVLKPGMTVRIRINLGERKDVIAIPKNALLDDHLFVVEDSTAKQRDVEVGLIGDEYVEIISGVDENEKIVVVGQQRLAGGEKVNPIER